MDRQPGQEASGQASDWSRTLAVLNVVLGTTASLLSVFQSLPALVRLLNGRNVGIIQLSLDVVVTGAAVALTLLAVRLVRKPFWRGVTVGGTAVAVAAFIVLGAVYLTGLGGATVRIGLPRDGDPVSSEVRATGSFERLSDAESIWLAVIPLGLDEELLFPQNGPAEKLYSGTWEASIFVGLDDPADYGRSFKILAIVTSTQADGWFRSYLAQGRNTGSFPGVTVLPPGARVMDVVTVTRRRE